MSSALSTVNTNHAITIPDEERGLIRKTWGKDLSELEFQQFIAYSQETGLSIIKRECAAVKFNGVTAYFPTVHGAVKMASRSPTYDGMDGPYFCGPDGRWVELWTDDKIPPTAAKTIVYRTDRARPAVGIALWAERKQTYRDKNNGREMLMPTWAKMPSHMLGKVSKTDALKASGLIGDEQIWYEEVDEIDGAEIRVVENRRDTANRRLHGAVASAGLGGHAEARALAAQVRPGITSLTDPSLTAADMHAAADMAEHLDHDYVEALITGEQSLVDTAVAVTNEPVDDDREFWRTTIREALAGDYKTASPRLVEYAKVEPWRFLDLIELAPAEKYASIYRTAAINAGTDPQGITRSLKVYQERKQIAASAPPAAEADPTTELDRLVDWVALWKRADTMYGIKGAAAFVQATGKAIKDFGGDPQAAWDALVAAKEGAGAQPAPEPDVIEVDGIQADASTGEIVDVKANEPDEDGPNATPMPERPGRPKFGDKLPPPVDRHTS